MKLEWMGAYRDIVGDFYRSANGYSQICKTELFGEKVRFSPYEVQIMEHVLEYADEQRNMKWYAERLGLSQATYSKYVRKLVNKGLIEKYHASNNKKDIIYCVVTRAEIFELKSLLREFPGSTFTTISEVSEVVGNHIKSV